MIVALSVFHGQLDFVNMKDESMGIIPNGLALDVQPVLVPMGRLPAPQNRAQLILARKVRRNPSVMELAVHGVLAVEGLVPLMAKYFRTVRSGGPASALNASVGMGLRGALQCFVSLWYATRMKQWLSLPGNVVQNVLRNPVLSLGEHTSMVNSGRKIPVQPVYAIEGNPGV